MPDVPDSAMLFTLLPTPLVALVADRRETEGAAWRVVGEGTDFRALADQVYALLLDPFQGLVDGCVLTRSTVLAYPERYPILNPPAHWTGWID